MNNDSLRLVLQNEKTDSITISGWMEKVKELSTGDMGAALTICKWVEENTLRKKYYHLYVKNLLRIAGLYHLTHDFPEAIEYYTRTQEAAERYGESELALETLNNLANVYYLNNQFDKAEELYRITVAECEKRGIVIGLAAGYGSLANLYFSTSGGDKERIKKGIDYMRKSIKASESLKDTAQLIPSFSSLGRVFSSIDMYDSALYYSNKSGEMILAAGNREDAYTYYYYHRGHIFLKSMEYAVAIQNFQKGLPYTKKYSTPLWESSHYDGLHLAYKALGDFRSALTYAERHFAIEDSIINAKNFSIVADKQNKYERAKKDQEIERLGKEKVLAADRRNRLTRLFLVALGTVVILSVLIFLLMRNIRSRKKAYALLEQQNTEIREQALQLSRQARIIAKFQSQMNPHFTFNALHNIYGLVATNENEKAVQQIQSLASLMRQTLTNSVKDEITLEEEIGYLQKYIDFEKAAVAGHFDFTVNVDAELEDALIPPMMIQPFVENAIKHAGLEQVNHPFVKVMIQKEQDLMKLIIEDNGKGIDEGAGNLQKLSHSVAIIRSRIEMLLQAAGKVIPDFFSIHTGKQAGKGTIVQFYLPLNYSH